MERQENGPGMQCSLETTDLLGFTYKDGDITFREGSIRREPLEQALTFKIKWKTTLNIL